MANQEMRETIRQMLTDWDNATDDERESSLKTAHDKASGELTSDDRAYVDSLPQDEFVRLMEHAVGYPIV